MANRTTAHRCACSAVLVALLLCAACGDDGDGIDLAQPVAGTSVYFALDADLASPATFFDFPYPSDLRLRADGTPDVAGYPIPVTPPIVAPLKAIAGDRRGFPVLPVAYFRFDGALAAQDIDRPIAAVADAPILLLDITAASPDRGRLFPTIATSIPSDPHVPEHLLAVAGAPGIVLPAGRTYAFVVMRAFSDAGGAELGVPASFARLRAGYVSDGANGAAARAAYDSLWETLDDLGVPRASVAAATVFTTGDVVADLAALSSSLLARHSTTIENLHLDPDDGASHPRFCELLGTATLPQFQAGAPPFDTEGLFVPGADGVPVPQRDESIPVVLTIPRQPMPAGGYPFMAYFHGSGGRSSQVVDRGPISEPGGNPRRGEGPAHVVAAHGIAAMGSALPLNPERLPGAAPLVYINFANLAAYRDTFRQGAIEQRLLIDAVDRLAIDPTVLARCSGPQLPAGESAFRLRTDPMAVLGQSMGAQYANFVAAIEPRIGAVVPTGSGGLWSLLVLNVELIPGVPTAPLIAQLLGANPPLTHLHPGLQLLEQAWEPAEPLAYAPRLTHLALPEHPARSIYQPVGQGDSDFPEIIFDAMALAHGNQQAGDELWPSMQASLALAGLDGILPYPVAANRAAASGVPYTGVVVQYAGDGLADPHHIFVQLDAVKYQYGCFLETFFDTGAAIVPPPRALGSPCR